MPFCLQDLHPPSTPPPLHPWPCTLFWDRLKIVHKIWSSLSHLTDFILCECRLKAPCQFFLLGFWGRHSTAFTLGWVGSWGHNSVAAAKRQEAPPSNSLSCMPITRKDEEVQWCCCGFCKVCLHPYKSEPELDAPQAQDILSLPILAYTVTTARLMG